MKKQVYHQGLQRVWTNQDKSKCYLIDDAAPLAAGDMLIRTATGAEQYVTPASVSALEIGKEEANQWLKKQLKSVLSQLRFSPPKAAKKAAADKSEATDDSITASKTPGLDLLANITQTPREVLNNDYNAVGKALGEYFTQTAQAVVDGASDDAMRKKAAAEKIRQWEALLNKHQQKKQ